MTRHAALLTGLLLLAGTPASRAQAPATDIFIIPVEGDQLGTPVRITDREGYDNQPCFLPDGKRLVYASQRNGQTDIFLHDLQSGESRPLRTTSESEYSPTPIPGRDAVSVVRDHGDLVQQLWSFPLQGGEPELLLPDIGPVGYHAWIDGDTVLLFVLGEPPTLQRAGVGPGRGDVLAESPGRSLAGIPGSAEMSWVDRSGDTWWLMALDPATGKSRRLVATLPGREDVAWSRDGSAWMADGSRLYRWRPGAEEWSLVADLAGAGPGDITRLAFSPDGRLLALVGSR